MDASEIMLGDVVAHRDRSRITVAITAVPSATNEGETLLYYSLADPAPAPHSMTGSYHGNDILSQQLAVRADHTCQHRTNRACILRF